MQGKKLIEIVKGVSAGILERARVARFVPVHCPAELCTCGRRGGKFLCEVEERDGAPVLVRTVCPNAKSARPMVLEGDINR
jgi:hypothetical protein